MRLEELRQEIAPSLWDEILGKAATESLTQAPGEEVEAAWREVSGSLVRFPSALCGSLFRLRCVAQWKKALVAVNLAQGAQVLEVATGASDPVPRALSLLLGSEARYVAVNLNHRLTEGLRRATADLPLTVDIIEDNAANLRQHLPDGTFDVICFHHAINDVVQTILCDLEGVDTIEPTWGEVLPRMVELAGTYWKKRKFHAEVGLRFLETVEVCYHLLKPGGHIIFCHHQYESDLRAGYPPDLYAHYIDIVRRWLRPCGLGIVEVTPRAFDRHWWLFVRKVAPRTREILRGARRPREARRARRRGRRNVRERRDVVA